MPRPPLWNSPTKAIRLSARYADDLIVLANLLDRPPSLHWHESTDLKMRPIENPLFFRGHVQSLLTGFEVGDSCMVAGKPGVLGIDYDAADNPSVVHVADDNTQTVFNKRATQSAEPEAKRTKPKTAA